MAVPVPALPSAYAWTLKEGAPKMMVEALKCYGTIEVPGSGNNPTILAWAKEVGGDVAQVYNADAIPWCGLFMAVIAKRAGYAPPKDPLWALNWGSFGQHVDQAMYGDVMVFVRKTTSGARAGHVTLYVGEDSDAYHVYGGNQSDKVCFERIAKNRLYTVRRPIFKIGQPANVRKIFLTKTGVIATNEA